MRQLPKMPLRTGFIPFSGGLDTETPPLFVEPGRCSDSMNVYQSITGGYTFMQGYERYDGQASPSNALYSILTVSGLSGVSVGDEVTDGVETATVIAVASSYLVLTQETGAFTPGELLVGATVVGTFSAPQSSGSASTPELDSEYLQLASEAYRDDIAPPEGDGPTLGGKRWNGVLYVFRNAADNLSAKLWKSSTAGWVEVPLGTEIAFTSGGTFTPSEGDTITGATSGSTADILRVVLESGSWDAGDAAGRFIIDGQDAPFVAENLNIGTNLNVASVAGDSAAITLAPGGRYQIIKGNFTGSPSTERLYGCDGENYGFEFDGSVFVQIHTGMSIDTPDHVHILENHLVFSFSGSMQNSATGFPYQWEPYLGAAEIAMGDPITGFVTQSGVSGTPATAVLSKNSIRVLYGSSRDDWKLVPFLDEAGALPFSMQTVLGKTLMLDTRGITSLEATQNYGNFAIGSLSATVATLVNQRSNFVVDSCVIRSKNLYCLFFSDGSGLFCTMGINKNGVPVMNAIMPFKLGEPAVWVDSTETSDGQEEIFFGGQSGMVYQMEKGKSFDGADLPWSFNLHFVNFKTPSTMKRFRGLTIEIKGEGYAEFGFMYQIGYASEEYAQPSVVDVSASMEPTMFDEAYFDECFFDGVSLLPSRLELCGNAENISLIFYGKNNFSSPVTISGGTVLYSLTREKR